MAVNDAAGPCWKGATACWIRLVASSSTACVGCRSSLAETTGNSNASTQAKASTAFQYGTLGSCDERPRLAHNSEKAASAIAIQSRLSSSSMESLVTILTASLVLPIGTQVSLPL